EDTPPFRRRVVILAHRGARHAVRRDYDLDRSGTLRTKEWAGCGCRADATIHQCLATGGEYLADDRSSCSYASARSTSAMKRPSHALQRTAAGWLGFAEHNPAEVTVESGVGEPVPRNGVERNGTSAAFKRRGTGPLPIGCSQDQAATHRVVVEVVQHLQQRRAAGAITIIAAAILPTKPLGALAALTG